MYLEIAYGISVRIVLDFLAMLLGITIAGLTIKLTKSLKESSYFFTFCILSIGVTFAALATTTEFLSNFLFEEYNQILQLCTGILGFVFLFAGFYRGFKVNFIKHLKEDKDQDDTRD